MILGNNSKYKIYSNDMLFLSLLSSLAFACFVPKAEVVNKFSSKEDVFNALRASCHVPPPGSKTF